MNLRWKLLCISLLYSIFINSTVQIFVIATILFFKLNKNLFIFCILLYLNVNYYLAPLIVAFFLGASACLELSLYKETRRWLHMGLAVSFDECFKRVTRSYARNVSRKLPCSVQIRLQLKQAIFIYTALSSY